MYYEYLDFLLIQVFRNASFHHLISVIGLHYLSTFSLIFMYRTTFQLMIFGKLVYKLLLRISILVIHSG